MFNGIKVNHYAHKSDYLRLIMLYHYGGIYYDIDTSVEANVIQPLARIFVAANWEIKPVLEALFKSEHFFDLNSSNVLKYPF